MPAIEKGYIKLARALEESEVWNKPRHFRDVWIWLLLHATHTPRKNLLEGQLFASYDDIIKGTKWEGGEYTETNIQCAIRYLKRNKMIVNVQSTRKMKITILNYAVYQDGKNYQVHSQSIDSPQRIHEQSTQSPPDIQELNNKENIYIPDRISFYDLWDEAENESGMEAPRKYQNQKFDNWEKKGWTFENGNPFENRNHLKKAIKTCLENYEPENRSKNGHENKSKNGKKKNIIEDLNIKKTEK